MYELIKMNAVLTRYIPLWNWYLC